MSVKPHTLSDLLQEACNLVKREPWFMAHNYEAIPQDTGDLDNTLKAKLFTVGERSLIMFTIEGFTPESSASTNPIGTVELVAMVSEKAQHNRSRPTWAAAFTVAENLAVYMNLKTIFEHTLYNPKIEFRPDAGLLNYRVSFKIQYVLKGLTNA